MTYSVKEIFYTLQGEGAQSGRPAVFCRFAGCNLWSGLERDRAKAVCTFCDTDFVGVDGEGGGKFARADELADAIAAQWPAVEGRDAQVGKPYVVCTGGEPLLQIDQALIAALRARGFEIAVETNGTLAAPEGLDWICVSPKTNAAVVQDRGDELKLVYPQETAMPERFAHMRFRHFFLQPMDGPERERNTRLAIEYCKTHPQWRLSVQMHKLVGIP
ncbi:MAG TPA: 7-carboxy-7-deazaguanine synthase [Burkholderiales bacterium]|nr:7-carboxy-7-deazaguanine synthase [Burkholderiales bacterium]